MVAGGPGLWLFGRFSAKARWLLRLLGAAYAGGGLLMARRAAAKNGANPVLTFAAMATMHISYGLGFIAGWWNERQRQA